MLLNLFISIVLSLLVAFLMIYAFTLPLFPKDWREKVNSKPNSLNPKYNNESITGILIILLSSIALVSWIIYFLNFIY